MSTGHKYTEDFIKGLERMALSAGPDEKLRDVSGGETGRRKYLLLLVAEARELLKYNEWLIALENTLDNLSEYDLILPGELLHLAEEAEKQSVLRDPQRELHSAFFRKRLQA